MITVVNKRTHAATAKDAYIGRGSPLGNPYSHLASGTLALYQVASREEAVECYKVSLLERVSMRDSIICNELNRLYKLAKQGDLYLVCYCAPCKCHGEIIKQLLEAKLAAYYEKQVA